MNNFFRRLPLPAKFMVIGLVPFAFMLYLTLHVYNDQIEKVDLLQSFLLRIRQTSNINNLINELQAERKFSYDYTLKRENGDKLYLQRSRTDYAIKKLQESEDLLLSDFTHYTFLNDLQINRTIVDTGRLQHNSIMYYYTNAIYRLNTLNAMPGGTVSYLKPVYSEIVGQRIVSDMSTNLGIITTNIYNILYSKQYVIETLAGTRGVYDVYKTYETEFRVKVAPSSVAAYDIVLSKPALKSTINYVDRLFKTFDLDTSYTAESWNLLSSQGLEQLKEFQKEIWKSAEFKLNRIYNYEKAKKDRTIILLVLVLLFVVVVVVYTLRVITKMLNELKTAAQKISIGSTGIEFKNVPDDVIGSLARSISEIDSNNIILSKAANAIGKGDFDVAVQPRSADDLLGNSILKMKKNLEHFIKENEELMRKKDEFMSVASHELKTPITSVKGALQIVERFILKDEKMKTVQPFVIQANKQVNKLTEIINDLLDITKIQSGQLELYKTDFIIKDLLQECLEQISFHLNSHQVVFEGNADQKIHADKLRVEQVINNLISNAIKYSPGKDKIIITAEKIDNDVRISVKDFGIGIDKEKIPFIFGRFFRVEETSQSFSGLGLGLYISSEIISRHNGKIGVDSSPGNGSTFWVTIPA